MTMAAGDSLLGLFALLMVAFLLLLLFFFLAYLYRPWRFLLHSPRPSSSRAPVTRADDLEKPLFSEDFDHGPDLTSDLSRVIVSDESSFQTDAIVCSSRTHGLVTNQRFLPTDSYASQGDNLAVGMVSDTSEDLVVGQTLKRSAVANWPVEAVTHVRREEANYGLEFTSDNGSDNGRHRVSAIKDNAYQRSCLSLEVISGPSIGLHCSGESTNTSSLPLTLGRVSSNDLVLKDSEVSGKHALIKWNTNRSKWELVDMGSLNGTLLNSLSVSHPDLGGRHWSEPVELANGDIITLGTSSKILVQIMLYIEHHIPFGVGMASDPMSMRRGGKKLPMEDMCYCQWPLPGVEQFGLFGIFDGHGGDGAAKDASKIMPKLVTNILSNPEKKERVLSRCDASQVLRDVFSQTEDAMNHQYEGCTATILLVWADHDKDLFVQCANVGDSACIMNINGTEINMTEDHRVTSLTERARLSETRRPLKDGEARLCGLNLVRMLGDKFLKEQDSRFSSEPYVSQVVHIRKASMAFVLMASDGLWDVISFKRASQLVLQTKERYLAHKGNSAEMIANFVLNEARTLRTRDNTSVIFLDFDTLRTESSCNVQS